MMPEEVKRHVARFYRVTRAEMEGRKRHRIYSWPRQVAMAMCRRYTRCSLPQIGYRFRRDHTTVICAIRKVNEAVLESQEHAAEIALLCTQIEAGAVEVTSEWAKTMQAKARKHETLHEIAVTEKTAADQDTYSQKLAASQTDFSARQRQGRKAA